MSAAIEHVLWLNAREDAALLAHALCGDELSHPDHSDEWFTPSRVSRSDRLLLINYEAPNVRLRLCVMLPETVSLDWVTQLREQVSARGAETKWAHFVRQMGRFESAAGAGAPCWSEATFTHESRRWRARRERHPSAVIDRLLARDRAEAEAYLKAAAGGVDAGDDAGMGESPRASARANVGDSRAE